MLNYSLLNHALLKQLRLFLLLCLGLILTLPPGTNLAHAADSAATANTQATPDAGKVIFKRGKVDIMRADSNNWARARSGTIVKTGDTLRTSFSGKAKLVMADETMLHLKRNSKLKVEAVVQNAGWQDDNVITRAFKDVARSVYSVISGSIWARNKNREVRANFRTSTATIGIRGTELTISASEDETSSSVLEGSIEVSNDAGTIVANEGETVTARAGQAPTSSQLINPLDAVQWTIAVPPLIDMQTISAGEFAIDSQLQSQLDAQDYAAASENVRQQLENDPGNTRLQVLDAVLDLQLGDIRSADNKLAQIPGGDNNDLVLRSRALTRLMLGDREMAVSLANKAVESNSGNAVNHVIKAYTQQAQSDLEGARNSVDQALSIQADNTTALLIKAQLQFASGEQSNALSTLRTARSSGTQSALVENLAGFVLMSERHHGDAKQAFQRAIDMDPSLAEPRMGLGLIAMRQGEPKQALQQISTAVALEPQRAIFLTYWGKMLYQVRRFDKALDMFAQAEKIDPNDPTPAYYRSIILRDLNRHGEAIQSLNEAIAKNDNRSVYRSSFLLDEDLAARNVDLSLLYNRLGLERWAERKAVTALKEDYTNSSAHLFLAGALAQEEDRSYPASSEALLARMLMPANINTFNTFNEYTSLFEEPGAGGQVTVGAGSQSTAVGEAIVYGAVPDSNLAYQAGIFGSTTDGWRDTNFEDTASAAVLGKWQATRQDGLFGSVLVSQQRLGDKFDPRYEFDDPASPDDRTTLDLGSLELGYHRETSPGSDLLLYTAYQDNELKALQNDDNLVIGNLYSETTDDSESTRPFGQIQLHYMHKTRNHQFFIGALGLSGSTETMATESVDAVDRGTTPPGVTPVFLTTTDSETDIGFYSIYLQDNWSINKDFTIEAAVYFDRLERDTSGTESVTTFNNGNPGNTTVTTLNDDFTQDEVNPRLGLVWEPSGTHTIRLGAFRYLLPFVSSRVDNTEIAGISVFRNTAEGTLTEEVHAVWEIEQHYGLYTISGFHQEQTLKASSTAAEIEGENDGARLGLDLLLSDTFGLAGHYRYLKSENLTDTTKNRTEHLVRLSLRHQNPNGFSAGISQIFRSIDFDDTVSMRQDEDIPITDIDFLYEFANKRATVGLLVTNIFDEEFNWVVDSFVFVGRNPAREFLVTGTLNF